MLNRLIAGLVLGLVTASAAQAVPWCHRGHIQEVANVTYAESDLLDWANDNIDWGNPPNVLNLHYYIGFHASHDRCQVHAGWSGPTFNVPGAGQVVANVYAPWTYTSTLNGYTISQGLQFRCMKCLPMRQLVAKEYLIRE
jgi:hypothetical protein